MKLQLTIDHGKRHEVIALVDRLADHVDVVEIGYPQVVTFGLELIEELRAAHPDLCLCVDAKVFHGGTGVTTRCFEAGANIVTCLSAAPNPVIEKMVAKAASYGGKIMCDMSAPARSLAQRTAEVDDLGVDYVAVHTGYLPEYDYDLETHRRWFTPKVKPLDLAKVAKRNLRHAGLCLNTGINESNIREVVALGPEVIMVGRGILDTDDWVAAAERLKRFMPFEG
ncbi:MAG: orotidine 5'-phosphate decarboxylase [Atopobiaceae bacterium]|nr:orotidine 5'-phosphate decarboxylase [Atopobiaceae bacterium]MBR1827950.1 orotidine 5'-phosphate decarboxylase [Atopobiaceae bacterium]